VWRGSTGSPLLAQFVENLRGGTKPTGLSGLPGDSLALRFSSTDHYLRQQQTLQGAASLLNRILIPFLGNE
jgi:hypothetical protein